MSGGKIAIKTKITLFSVADIFMWFYILFAFVITSINSAPVFFQMRFVSLLFAGGFGYLQLLKGRVRNSRIILFILAFAASWAASFLIRGSGAYEPNLFLYSVLYMGMAVNMVSHRHSVRIPGFLFFVVCATSLVRLLILKEPIRGFLKDGTTYNFISVLLLFFLAFYCIALIQNNEKIPYVAAIVFAWISLLVYGRGGIITGLFFLVFVIFWGTKDETNRKKRGALRLTAVVTVIVGVVALLAFLGYIRIAAFESVFAKFYEKNATDEPRLEIWSGYIRACSKSLRDFIFGADSKRFFVDGNLHNAFVQLHSAFGMIPFLLLLYTFVRLAVYSFKTKRMYLLCLLLTIVIRSMTDKTAFQGYCEPLFYYLAFTWLNVREKKRMVSGDGAATDTEMNMG